MAFEASIVQQQTVAATIQVPKYDDVAGVTPPKFPYSHIRTNFTFTGGAVGITWQDQSGTTIRTIPMTTALASVWAIPAGATQLALTNAGTISAGSIEWGRNRG